MNAKLMLDPLPWLDTLDEGVRATIARQNGEETVSDVHASLLAGRYLLWLLIDDDGAYRGFILTEKIGGRLPRVNLAHVYAVNGLDEVVSDVFPKLAAHAKSLGCTAVEFTSARPFHRVETGFKEVYRIYRREVDDA